MILNFEKAGWLQMYISRTCKTLKINCDVDVEKKSNTSNSESNLFYMVSTFA